MLRLKGLHATDDIEVHDDLLYQISAKERQKPGDSTSSPRTRVSSVVSMSVGISAARTAPTETFGEWSVLLESFSPPWSKAA